MKIAPERESISADEINLYDYWKILLRRKNILLGIVFVLVITAIIIALIIPRYYRGECEITLPAIHAQKDKEENEVTNSLIPLIPAQDMVGLVGNIDDAKKSIIFATNSGAIKNVLISISKKSTDKLSVIIDAKTKDIIPQAYKDIFYYINNLIKYKRTIANIKKAKDDLKTERFIREIDFKIKKLLEVKKANLIFLSQITDMMKEKQIRSVNVINPADLINKDLNISLEINNLEQAKSDAIKKIKLNVEVNAGILGLPSITKQPSNKKILLCIIVSVIMSLMAGIFIVFFLEYIEQMKMRHNK